MSDKTQTEAVGIFHSAKDMESAADALLSAGFDRADLSILAGKDAVEEKLGHAIRSVAELEDAPDVATEAYSQGDSMAEAKAATVGGLFFVGAVAAAGAVVASGGTMLAAIVGAVAAGGAGGAIGGVMAKFLGHEHADSLQTQLDKGGILLWVRTPDSDHETRALEVLRANGGEDVHLHALPEVPMGEGLEIYGYLDWLSGEPRPKD